MTQNNLTVVGPDGGTPINLTGSLVMDNGVTIPGAPTAPGVLSFQVPDGSVGIGGNATVQCDGSKPWTNRIVTDTIHGGPLIIDTQVRLEPIKVPFPHPDSQRDALLPVESGDEYGNVSDTFPPEFLALPGAEPQFAHIDLIRGDAFTYETPFAPRDINPLCDFAWLQSIGQNTNFGERMWYTPLLPLYPGDVQDAFLADYSRYNTHLLLQGSLDLGLVRATCEKAKAVGLYVCVFDWDAGTFTTLLDVIDLAIIGLEVDKIGSAAIAAGELDATIATACARCVPKGIRVWLHFTSSGGPTHDQHWAFPVPGMSYTDWWAQNDRLGVAGLMYESWMTYGGDMDSAGKMGAMMFYARQGLHYSSKCLLCACEIMSAPPFMDKVNGPFAWRRATEMVCAPNGGVPGMVGVAGSFNGARKWEGSVM